MPAGLALGLLLTLGCGQSEPTAEPQATPRPGDAVSAPSDSQPAGPPIVEIATTLGKIAIELEPDKAPLTVGNFLEYVDHGHYDGTIFHQIAHGVAALGGGYSPQLVARPANPPVRNEADSADKNRRGTIALARNPDVIDSGAAEFFLNLADNPELDHKGKNPQEYGYCVFGHVTSGLDTLERLSEVPVADQPNFQQVPKQAVLINSVRRLR